MRFSYFKSIGRSREEQRVIQSMLELWKFLPDRTRDQVLCLIDDIAADKKEGMCLRRVLTQASSVENACAACGVSKHRLDIMRKEFYRRMPTPFLNGGNQWQS